FMIPFKTLRFTDSPSQEWGLQIARNTLRVNEDSDWSPLPIRYSQFKVSLAGTLTGLENIRQARNLKVKPYVAAGVTQFQTGTQVQTLRSFTRLNDYD